jgi:hypothetical protein
MEKLSNEELRALRLLAQYPSGCTEPVILAHGFKLDQIANLVFRGFTKREVSNVTIGEPTCEDSADADHRHWAESNRRPNRRPPPSGADMSLTSGRTAAMEKMGFKLSSGCGVRLDL